MKVGNHAVDQMDPSGSGKILASYFFKDITALYEVPDYPGGFVIEIGPHGRLHLFAAEARSEILSHILENCSKYIGVCISKPKSMVQISLLVPLNLFKYLLLLTFLCLNKSKISQKSQIGLAEMSPIAKSGNSMLMICFDLDKTVLPDMAIMGIPTCPI